MIQADSPEAKQTLRSLRSHAKQNGYTLNRKAEPDGFLVTARRTIEGQDYGIGFRWSAGDGLDSLKRLGAALKFSIMRVGEA